MQLPTLQPSSASRQVESNQLIVYLATIKHFLHQEKCKKTKALLIVLSALAYFLFKIQIFIKVFAFRAGADDELVQEVSTPSWKQFEIFEKCCVCGICSPCIQNQDLFGKVRYPTCVLSCQQEGDNSSFSRTGFCTHSYYDFYVLVRNFCIQDTSIRTLNHYGTFIIYDLELLQIVEFFIKNIKYYIISRSLL